MELISNAKDVLLKAWSVRLALLSALFSGAEALALVLPYLDGIFPPHALSALFSGAEALALVLPYLDGIFPPHALAGLGALAAIGAVGSRIVAQPKTLP